MARVCTLGAAVRVPELRRPFHGSEGHLRQLSRLKDMSSVGIGPTSIHSQTQTPRPHHSPGKRPPQKAPRAHDIGIARSLPPSREVQVSGFEPVACLQGSFRPKSGQHQASLSNRRCSKLRGDPLSVRSVLDLFGVNCKPTNSFLTRTSPDSKSLVVLKFCILWSAERFWRTA